MMLTDSHRCCRQRRSRSTVDVPAVVMSSVVRLLAIIVVLMSCGGQTAETSSLQQQQQPNGEEDGWLLDTTAVAADQVQTFSPGNSTAVNDFHELLIDGDSLLLGARNVVYNISLETFTEANRLLWNSSYDDVQLCLMRQKSLDECQNYVRVIARQKDNTYLVCGTNAFRPLCRTYVYDDTLPGYSVREVESGVARCPYDPSHNSTTIYANGRLYSATVADLSSRDPLIYSKPLRTEQHDSQWLNDPNFVSTFHYNGMVYFFFRETAVENINCGKAVFSRVARVCMDDEGGVRVLRNTWTSFFKARLNCSIPGEFPFYFDELQSTSELGDGNVFPTFYQNRLPMVYAVFTTPRNSLRGSAVCAFKMSDIVASFDGPHKEQKTAHSNWLPVRDSDIPDPHPAKGCANSSTLLSDQTLNFIKSHPLMDKAVPAFSGHPLLIQSSLEYSLTQITVDWQVPAVDKWYYDVMFIGTDNGRVLKVINKSRLSSRVEPVIVEDLRVFDRSTPVIGLRIYNRRGDDRRSARLLVMSRDSVRSLPLHRCHLKTSCAECVALRDPYCSWVDDKCVHSAVGYQNIEMGRHSRCPAVMSAKSLKTSSPHPASSVAEQNVCAPCFCANSSPILTSSHKSGEPSVDIINSAESVLEEVHDGDDEMDNKIFPDGNTLHHSNRFMAVAPCYEAALDRNRGGNANTVYYTTGNVAVITILSIIAALIVGFIAGFCLSSHRHLHCLYRRMDHIWGGGGRLGSLGGGTQMHGDKISSSPSMKKHAIQNPYDLDPVKYQIQSTSSPLYNPLLRTKDDNISRSNNVIFNELKSNNLNMAGCSNDGDSEMVALCLSSTRPLPCISNCQVEAAVALAGGIPPRPPPRRHRSVRVR